MSNFSKEYFREQMRLWRLVNPERARAHGYRQRYGMTLEESRQLQELHGVNRQRIGKCQICGECKRLEFDHCHETSKFRGFLCRSCNQTVWHFEKGHFVKDREMRGKISRYVAMALHADSLATGDIVGPETAI